MAATWPRSPRTAWPSLAPKAEAGRFENAAGLRILCAFTVMG